MKTDDFRLLWFLNKNVRLICLVLISGYKTKKSRKVLKQTGIRAKNDWKIIKEN